MMRRGHRLRGIFGQIDALTAKGEAAALVQKGADMKDAPFVLDEVNAQLQRHLSVAEAN